MKETIRLLQDLSDRIEKAKRDKATIDGRQSEILRQLQESFDVKTIKQAENLLTELTEEVTKLERRIKNRVAVLFDELEKNEGKA